ncbi:TPR end-of-group domain-containing protein [Paraburkholderia diazotrophica]|uniref:TPR end-of-group domain-containing protein n=1 Tax=Paraburkholderia diazotrophica TaxID=667676 RepID=UPI00317C8799
MKLSFRHVAVSLTALTLFSACSKSSGPSILGHWHAEHVNVYSLQLPVGPDIVVSDNQILSPDTGASIPVTRIQNKDDTATVDLPLGVGLTFYFDGADRMYMKVPLVGRVYYRRVAEPAQAVASQGSMRADVQKPASAALVTGRVMPAEPSTGDITGQIGKAVTSKSADVNKQPQQGSQPDKPSATGTRQLEADAGSAEYKLALVAASEGDTDSAIGHLSDAFKDGFRMFNLLESAPEFNTLKKDVRYQALVARYR